MILQMPLNGEAEIEMGHEMETVVTGIHTVKGCS